MATSRSSKPATLTVTIIAATAILAAGSYLYNIYMGSDSGSGLKGYSNPGAPKQIPAEKKLESDKEDAGESGPVEEWDIETLRKWLEKVSCLLPFRTEASVYMCNNTDIDMCSVREILLRQKIRLRRSSLSLSRV